MDTIADLLAKRMPSEPPEIRAIKDYIMAEFRETVGVTVRERDIVITVRSSALAGALRMHIPRLISALQAVAGETGQTGQEARAEARQRLIFRVGSI